MLWQHDAGQPIGVWDQISEERGGLKVKGRLALGVARAKEIHELMRMKAIDGLSIGYRTVKAQMDEARGVRKLLELDLWEVSLVTFPMLTAARVTSVKSEDIDSLDVAGIDRLLREAGGLSREQAKRVLHRHSVLVSAREAQKHSELQRTAAMSRLLQTLKS